MINQLNPYRALGLGPSRHQGLVKVDCYNPQHKWMPASAGMT